MKYMSWIDWLYLVVSCGFIVMFSISTGTYFDELRDMSEGQSRIILTANVMMVISYFLGSETFVRFVHGTRTKRIQAELDVERAFRKLNGEDHY
jgi:hypothetical protein